MGIWESSGGYLILVKMDDTTATSAVAGFSAALNRMITTARKSMTKDLKWRNMQKSPRKPALPFFFCDPHSPWQRDINENINGLIRQYLPKETVLAAHRQEELDAIAFKLNMRPRKRFVFKCPIKVMSDLMGKYHESPSTIQ